MQCPKCQTTGEFPMTSMGTLPMGFDPNYYSCSCGHKWSAAVQQHQDDLAFTKKLLLAIKAIGNECFEGIDRGSPATKRVCERIFAICEEAIK